MKKISIVRDCSNGEENIEELYAQVKAIFDELGRYEFEIIFINGLADRPPAP